ncbi:LysR family transcriptional regulator [Cupriavidus pinatubonensis]|uniref:LysR family transcriptional regulator n=1 Tax=Cupriavidus pinatubonensis TaxID=248026 RepID=UPI002159D506
MCCFTGAARRLRRAQSAVSHAISALEAALGVELFERDTRRAELTAAGRSLIPDARAVITRTEDMKNRAKSISAEGVPRLSIAVDTYFPRKRLIDCLRVLQAESPTAAINLHMTTMQGGEALVLASDCSLAVTISDVPEIKKSAIERHWLCETPLVTVCAPTHPLAGISRPIAQDEFGEYVQLVVTDNQPSAETSQKGVAGERQWLVNDLGAKRDLLLAGLSWGHMPADLVAEDLAQGRLVEIRRRAWHIGPLVFVISRIRGSELSSFEERAVQLLAGEPIAAPM